MLPWVCWWDFNEVLFDWEKTGKRMAENYRMTAFREFLDTCSLMDIWSKGCALTWSNNREGDEYIKEWLGRVVCTIEWRLMLPKAEAFALPAIGSNHSPILLSFKPDPVKRRKEFKFKAFWLESDECKIIIKETWKSPNHVGMNLVGKLRVVTIALSKGSRKTFRNGQKRMDSLKQEVQQCINNNGRNSRVERVKHLQGEIEAVWRQEEMYWGLRSRINWLKWGDKNTKFFHATTV